ncbi:NAD-dependent succinate-semialdehyde dehydrogenase [Aquimarina addita]|uniref:NAD-dependent succinate-semialdehyde dehydrogenase n=1 Tax=Aquimarina addita TaxID=870485 RepID=A0ABP7X8H5_9FLAO
MSKKIKTIYPFTNEILKEYNSFSDEEIQNALRNSEESFVVWKDESVDIRVNFLEKLGEVLEDQKQEMATLITKEMGKPIQESIAEIEKCIWLIDFYHQNAEDFIADDLIDTEAQESFISYDPLGCILAIMPWNYPFWQVMRFAVPTLTAGNTALLKHANNVTGCALAIEKLFLDAGYPKGCFQTLLATHEQIETVIEDDIVKAVSLTGSEKAGKSIAEIAGRNLKKTVLELGGNNACIILEDADLDTYIDTIVKARMQNAGQSCIAAKRFIVVEGIYEKFIEKFKNTVESLQSGNPLEKETEIATMAREDLVETVMKQIEGSVEKGANILTGNKKDGNFFAPTILTDVKPEMPVFDEEVFGPVAAVCKVKNEKEAYELASKSRFGLGTMLFTEDIDAARMQISQIADGAFFINEMVKSDPRLPFGGTKASGYGRELSKEGMMEFVNKKTVYIK